MVHQLRSPVQQITSSIATKHSQILYCNAPLLARNCIYNPIFSRVCSRCIRECAGVYLPVYRQINAELIMPTDLESRMSRGVLLIVGNDRKWTDHPVHGKPIVWPWRIVPSIETHPLVVYLSPHSARLFDSLRSLFCFIPSLFIICFLCLSGCNKDYILKYVNADNVVNIQS